jgi:hypothetical protein
MKYHLIIGYHLIEKNKDYPTIRISLNNNFISEFDCDNEKTVVRNVDHLLRGEKLFYNTEYKHTSNRWRKDTFTMPCKFKTFELDSTAWGDNNKLCIEIRNNKSNYTNGFISRRSLVVLRPIYLIPTTLLEDKEKSAKLIKKCYMIDSRITISTEKKRWPWPGIHDDGCPEFFGGERKIYLDIKKKKNFFIITPDNFQDTPMQGFPAINWQFFSSWMKEYLGIPCNIKHTRKTIVTKDRNTVKEFIELVEKVD